MKKLAALLALLMSLSCFSACSFQSLIEKLTGKKVEEDVEQFVEVLGEQDAITLKPDETKTYAVNKNISGKEYIKLEFATNVNLVGQFKYHDINDEQKIVTEDFFIEADATEFKQFFDAFRLNGHGQFSKQLLSITLTNKSTEDGSVQLKKASVSGRVIDDYEREVYVTKGAIKVGADLATGGTLTYLERMNYNGQTVDEVIDKDGYVCIGVNAKSDEDTAQHLSSSVNLINIYDAGRQFQQSYYANVGGTSADTPEKVAALGLELGFDEYGNRPKDFGSNGYERAWCTTSHKDGYYWPYNPVQGGDCNSNPSQIIDYQVTEDEIYIKVRAMDWAKGNDGRSLPGQVDGGVTTKSYMENWYTVKGNMVYVRNRFIDWNGFKDLEKVPEHSNELPAAYVVHPLNHYTYYGGTDTSWSGDLTVRNDLDSWVNPDTTCVNGDSPRAEGGNIEKWFAWTNADGFGVGVYIPGTRANTSGRSKNTTHKDYDGNCNANQSPLAGKYRYNKPVNTSNYTSCYVGNTSYTAPVVTWTMKSYLPMEYTYVMSVDYVGVMRSQFKDLHESKTITNETLSAWSK